jgi:uncharacterized protein YbaR (Trm112 family)
VINNPRPYHIQINIDEASKKVISSFNCCRMISVFPKCSLTIFALIELLACPSCNQFNRIWDNIPFVASNHKKMNMIRSDCIIQYHQSVTLFCFIQPLKPSTSILGKFEQKFSLMASVGDEPYLSGYIVALCSRPIRLIAYIARFTPKKGDIGPN